LNGVSASGERRSRREREKGKGKEALGAGATPSTGPSDGTVEVKATPPSPRRDRSGKLKESCGPIQPQAPIAVGAQVPASGGRGLANAPKVPSILQRVDSSPPAATTVIPRSNGDGIITMHPQDIGAGTAPPYGGGRGGRRGRGRGRAFPPRGS